jgi:hypothetical protein
MIRTQIFAKVTDSEASPFIEQKDVILCRSGIQLYSAKELESCITEDNKPPKPKKIYKEYRPASVIVKAKDKFRRLPVTKEHPDVWVNPDNWKDLAGGVLDKEVDVVALEGESEGEIGLKSNITFYTNELYEYYLNNKETSVGYTCKKHFVDNPEEVGYDILLDEIVEVNHLAITRAGRGGSSVAVIDSIIGGLRPMRTGFFAFLSSKKAVNKDSAPSFGKEVLEAVKNSKGTTEEEIAGEMKGVLDSMSELKDCDAKDTLMNVVKDCFDNKDKVLALPQMESLKNKGYDVLVLTDNVDEFMIQVLREYDKVEFKNINSSDLDLLSDDEKKDIEKAKEDNKDLLTSIKEALPDVKDVVISTHLTDSACCLSSGEGISFEMEKVLNSQQGDNKVKAERILEINSNSELFKLIQESYKESKDSVKDYSKLLYDEALINQGLPLENPREFSNLLENLMKKSLSK